MDERRKVMGGAQLRKLRADLGLSQAAMADELGVSVSYVNLVERNQRPLTAQLLIRLAEAYGIDPRDFSGAEDGAALAAVDEVLADPLLAGLKVPKSEVKAALESAPTLLAALRRLHGAYAGLSEAQSDGPRDSLGQAGEAVEEVRGVIEAAHNHFPGLDEAGESIGEALRENALGPDLLTALAERLKAAHGVRVVILPEVEMGVTLRHYDRHRRRLMLSERLSPQAWAFQAAVQLVLFDLPGALDSAAHFSAGAEKLGRIALANYTAAAVLMPYARYLRAAQDLRYDVDRLAARFGVSWEQAAHRLTTLSRPQARGVPFFLLRVDQAGNISKRFSAGAFPFARQGGTCPRWNLHGAFLQPDKTLPQIIELPDGKRWLSMSRQVRRLVPGLGDIETSHSIALGCEMRFAGQIAHGDGLQKATPIGITCRLCPRPACASRSSPPLTGPLEISEQTRGLSPFGM
ncbi:helix-turn-helix domain-containing protein [Neogemmobacter tilapiae]|uniref:Transcriptional regulator n=1 Tax=Neogemmobacter tilapiae TaxID=875041 RepID=A0A918TMX5_9RHOB|nr:helix-turn-helix transcriptional regulator [Gemmobacter tilapiae]GHC55451.1 transcriptional regulator [Gemmobacter tilapiae]